VTAPTRILGIDPGLRLTGYGCLDTLPASESIVEAGVLRLGRPSASSPLHTPPLQTPPLDITSISARLAELDRDLRLLLSRLKPSIVAVEQLFAHPKHPATAITMAHARGIILLAVQNAGLQLIEIRPNEIKKSLTGYGHAAKGQMQDAIQAYFRLESTPKPPDVADALAIALCAASKHHRGLPTSTPRRKKSPRSLAALPPDVRKQIEQDLDR
jgi:crossover junction endodeoxyribonuclease RuvC